ncbi:MAG: hypothetical protein ABTQ27_08420 [Amaricoccus sp.]|uniref:hypothetical protein n=1 Tax=Amaricoccus sp. TaxID=1872485 RepID=UPI0033147AAC
MYLSDVITNVEAGGLAYRDASRRKILGSHRRTAAIYGDPANKIPADPDLFTRRWGKGKVTSYPIAHFDSAQQFADWRSNVRGAFAQASGAKAAAAVRRGAHDTWTDVLTAFDSVAGSTLHGDLFNKAQRTVLERLADCARREGIASDALTIDDAVRFRALHCITTNQKSALGRGVVPFDKLRALPGVAHLLPAAPLGRLPRMRLASGERLAAMPATFRAEWSAWRDGYQAGTPSALSGSTKPRSDGYIGQFDASIAWVIEVIAELGLDDPANLADLRALARPDWIKAAAQSVARAYDADGELVDDGAPARLSLRSLQTYLQRLGTIFEALGCNVAKATIARLLEDPKLKGLDGMTAENIAFCRSLVRSPSLQTVLFDLPWTLQATAQALLERWETLSLGERHAAIRMGACAVAMLLLTRCAPIRVKNLAGITYKGPKRWLSAPTKGGLALLLIPASETKNGKEIRAHLQNAGRKTSWSLVSWYLEHVRPRMAEVGSASRAAIDGPALFPGTAGTITRSTLRDWIKVETAACGLPMRPHQARHAIASILLNRNWNDIRKIAALLGDTVSTVERNYAWMDAEKLMADAQAMIPTAASLLKGTRRG